MSRAGENKYQNIAVQPLFKNHTVPYVCKIGGFHGGDYEECRVLGCNAVCVFLEQSFRKNVSPPLSGSTGTMNTD
jgi:hypothetical protein